jgi:hypothetical protein
MHAYGWHDEGYFIEQAGRAGKEHGHKGGARGGTALWWNNGVIETKKHDCPGKGWTRGRLQMSMCVLPYWNNGTDNKRSLECPGEDWKPGLLERWWTNGIINIKTGEWPGEGWKPGRSNLSVNRQKWMCTVSGRVSTAGPLTVIQKSLGIDTSNRVKLV